MCPLSAAERGGGGKAHGATPALLTELPSLFLNEEWDRNAVAQAATGG